MDVEKVRVRGGVRVRRKEGQVRCKKARRLAGKI
jgi:hypothetical protein